MYISRELQCRFYIYYLKSCLKSLARISDLSGMKRDALNEELPNTRKISRIIVNPENIFSNKVSSLMYSFGQFVDHDLTLSPGKRRSNPGLGCCIGFPDFKVQCCQLLINFY